MKNSYYIDSTKKNKTIKDLGNIYCSKVFAKRIVDRVNQQIEENQKTLSRLQDKYNINQ